MTRKDLIFSDEENYTFNSMTKRLYYLFLTILLERSFFFSSSKIHFREVSYSLVCG